MAWRRTDAPFVAIVNAVVVLEPNYFAFLLSKITEEVCCVGGKIKTVSRTLLGGLLRFWERTYRGSPNRRLHGYSAVADNPALRRRLLALHNTV
ncbi:MAG: hypothetical protein ACP5II_08220 [Infirmifilum sp.]|jgi:hypothetical protein|uniref:hypothetical protein n=1 Tax=Infirmifilum sp. TaxID=2856575 RepID=UPI003D09B362